MSNFLVNLIFLVFVSNLVFTNCPGEIKDKYLTFTIPVVANSEGAYNSKWKTNLYIENPASFAQYAYIYFIESGKTFENAPCFETVIEKYSMLKIEDVLKNLFQIENKTGSLIIQQETTGPEALMPFNIFFKTYDENRVKENLYKIEKASNWGLDKYLMDKIEYRILFLAEKNNIRTNIGFSSMVPFEIKIKIRINKDNILIGEKEIYLQPYSHLQINKILREFTDEEIEDFTIYVYSDTKDAKYFAYVSMINNENNQAVFIPF